MCVSRRISFFTFGVVGIAFCAWYSERSRIIQIPCLDAIILSIKSRHVNGIRQIYVHFLLLFTARATPFELGRAKGVAFVPLPSYVCRWNKWKVLSNTHLHFNQTEWHYCREILCFCPGIFSANTKSSLIRYCSSWTRLTIGRRRLSLNWIIFKWGEINVAPCGRKIEIIKKGASFHQLSERFSNEKESLMCRII